VEVAAAAVPAISVARCAPSMTIRCANPSRTISSTSSGSSA